MTTHIYINSFIFVDLLLLDGSLAALRWHDWLGFAVIGGGLHFILRFLLLSFTWTLALITLLGSVGVGAVTCWQLTQITI